MLRSNPCDPQDPPGRELRFVLYVEGPSDCDILRSWARLLSPRLSRIVADSAVILGGRRPARALEHFAGVLDDTVRARGICVLDRDRHEVAARDAARDAAFGTGKAPRGLEFFTWPRRHIESYLLVPRAMRRCMGMETGDPRLAEILLDLPHGEDELGELDAKRLLAEKAQIARELGVRLSAARIARCMSREDLHPDVVVLLTLLGSASELQPRVGSNVELLAPSARSANRQRS